MIDDDVLHFIIRLQQLVAALAIVLGLMFGEDRDIEFDHLEPRNGPQDLLDRDHDAGNRRPLLQCDPLRHRMHEQLPQIVQALGEELRDRRQFERHCSE